MEAHYIFQSSTIWVRPLLTELGPKKNPKADFAMKQTNICRLSGDIIKWRHADTVTVYMWPYTKYRPSHDDSEIMLTRIV